ncbi:hypothetical protein D3C80_2113610 [compost metagenome]
MDLSLVVVVVCFLESEKNKSTQRTDHVRTIQLTVLVAGRCSTSHSFFFVGECELSHMKHGAKSFVGSCVSICG